MGLAKRIIPCLDVDRGRVVKGIKFEDIRDAGDPVEISRHYNNEGADEITLLDITASHEDRNTTLDTVTRIASEVFIPLTVGGGVRSTENIRDFMGFFRDERKNLIEIPFSYDPKLAPKPAWDVHFSNSSQKMCV